MAELHRVLLGIADSFIGDDEDASVGWSTNKFGGVPVIIFPYFQHFVI